MAKPEKARSWVAIGAVRPTAVILRTKARRDIRPAFTWSKRPRKPRSSMGCLPSWSVETVPDAPAILQDACKPDGNRLGRRRQWLTAAARRPGAPSGFPIPARQFPGEVVPAAQFGSELVAEGTDDRTGDYGDHDMVIHDHVVQLDEQGGALQWIELGLGRLVDVVVFLVLPARDVAALPLVGLARHFPRQELTQEQRRVRLLRTVVVHLEVGVEVRIGVRVGFDRREDH